MTKVKDIVEQNQEGKDTYLIHIYYKESDDEFDPLFDTLWDGWIKDIPNKYMEYEVKSTGQSLSDLQNGITGLLVEVKKPYKMDDFFGDVKYIVENSALEINEKNVLLRFINMTKKAAESVEESKKLPRKAKSCFYKAYDECIKNACICYGIEDIIEKLLEH